MKRIKLGQFKDKSLLPNSAKFFVALKDAASTKFIYFIRRNNEIELILEHEVERWYSVVWTEPLIMQNERFSDLWQYCMSVVGEQLSADEFYRGIRRPLLKDPHGAHLLAIQNLNQLIEHYGDSK